MRERKDPSNLGEDGEEMKSSESSELERSQGPVSLGLGQ